MSGSERSSGPVLGRFDAVLSVGDEEGDSLPVPPVVAGGVAVLLGGLIAWYVGAPTRVGELTRVAVTGRLYSGRGPTPLVRTTALVVALLPIGFAAATLYTRDRRALFAAVVSLVPSTLVLFLNGIVLPELLGQFGFETTTGPTLPGSGRRVSVAPAWVRIPPAVATLGSVLVAVAALNAPTVGGAGDDRSWAGFTPTSSAVVAVAVALLALAVSVLAPTDSPLWTGLAGAGLAGATGAVTLTATGDRPAAAAAAALGAVPGVLAVATLARSVVLGGVVAVPLAVVAAGVAVLRLR